MNACDDGDEPMGEHPELTMPRTVGLIDRQTAALAAIREYARWLEDTPGCGDEPSPASGDARARQCVGRELLHTLQEHGLC